MSKTIVGLDIGSESLRAVELEGGRKARPTLVRFREIPLPEGAVKSGEVIEVNTVAAALKQLWSVGGFSTKRVVLGMGNAKVLVRDLAVPRLSLPEIRESLPFQVQEMLPVPVSEALLDFYPISESAGEAGPQVNGLLVAAVKDAVMSNVRAVQLAGLIPVDVDLIPFALNRVIVRGPSVEGTVGMIDIGANTTNVLITRNGVPQFVRIIPVGGSDVTRALSGRLEIPAHEAESLKRGLGLLPVAAQPEQREAAMIINEVSSELLNSLRNTLSFYVNSRQGQVIDRLVISGGGGALSNFAAALAELTRLPAALVSPFESVTIAKTAGTAIDPITASRMGVAMGLALGSAA